MFPFVNNAQVASQLVRAVKFPPLGDRGVDGAGMDADYTLAAWTPGADYCGDANRETFILAQIEAPEALDNVDENRCRGGNRLSLRRPRRSHPSNDQPARGKAVRSG